MVKNKLLLIKFLKNEKSTAVSQLQGLWIDPDLTLLCVYKALYVLPVSVWISLGAVNLNVNNPLNYITQTLGLYTKGYEIDCMRVV